MATLAKYEVPSEVFVKEQAPTRVIRLGNFNAITGSVLSLPEIKLALGHQKTPAMEALPNIPRKGFKVVGSNKNGVYLEYPDQKYVVCVSAANYAHLTTQGQISDLSLLFAELVNTETFVLATQEELESPESQPYRLTTAPMSFDLLPRLKDGDFVYKIDGCKEYLFWYCVDDRGYTHFVGNGVGRYRTRSLLTLDIEHRSRDARYFVEGLRYHTSKPPQSPENIQTFKAWANSTSVSTQDSIKDAWIQCLNALAVLECNPREAWRELRGVRLPVLKVKVRCEYEEARNAAELLEKVTTRKLSIIDREALRVPFEISLSPLVSGTAKRDVAFQLRLTTHDATRNGRGTALEQDFESIEACKSCIRSMLSV